MYNNSLPSKRNGNGGGKFFPALCNIIGTLLILAVIAASLPLTIPRYMGYEVYQVLSGSMEPSIPVGSVVYVAPTEPEEVQENDVIAFRLGDEVITHRVVVNRTSLGEFVTKGDANNVEDIDPVPYDALVGVVEKHYPVIGQVMSIYASTIGKVYLLLVALCGVMFNILAGRLREHRREGIRRQMEEEMAAGTFRVAAAEERETAVEGGARHVRRKKRFRWVRPLIMTILALIFAGSAGMVLFVMHQYKVSDRLYLAAAHRYTQRVETAAETDGTAAADKADGGEKPEQRVEVSVTEDGETTYRLAETAPLKVDFDDLTAVNSDVIGWIYCEDTSISYPVLRGENNDTYLHTTYEGNYSYSGSIFVESDNRPDFSDANTIIYGHHMKNGSMFAALDKWSKQSFYEEHPIMWLLTPDQDYKIVLISGYHTNAYSDVYTIFRDAADDFTAYLEEAVSASNFTADAAETVDWSKQYVLLSTCAYVFDNARYVLHGQLIPVSSAGGEAIAE